jgi:hypothetical protein
MPYFAINCYGASTILKSPTPYLDHTKATFKQSSNFKTIAMPPLSSSYDNHARAIHFETEHSYSVCAPLTKRPYPKAKKVVTFQQSVKAKKTLHINNYTEEEIQACWFDDDESKQMKEEFRLAANLAMNGLLPQESSRGLELYTKEAQSRRQHKATAREEVLDEQELQWDEGAYDPEYIAQIYEAASASSRARARSTGFQDELFSLI